MARRPFDPAASLKRLVGRHPGAEAAPFRIDHDGRWYHDGAPIARPALVDLFASVLQRAADGRYWLVTPAEAQPVHVEAEPFLGVELAVEGEGRAMCVRVRPNTGPWVEIGPAHPFSLRAGLHADEEVPVVQVRAGIAMRLISSVFYELVELALPAAASDPGAGDGEAEARLLAEAGFWSRGCWFALRAGGRPVAEAPAP